MQFKPWFQQTSVRLAGQVGMVSAVILLTRPLLFLQPQS
jgi:hypothetical protein